MCRASRGGEIVDGARHGARSFVLAALRAPCPVLVACGMTGAPRSGEERSADRARRFAHRLHAPRLRAFRYPALFADAWP